MIKIHKWVVNPYQECTYIIHDETGEAIVIDCGAYYLNERRRLLEYIETERLRPVRLLLTHAHHDHLYGNDLMLEHFGLYPELHKADRDLMLHQLPLRLRQLYGDRFPYSVPLPQRYLKSDETIGFGNHHLKVLSTPGHTPGSVVFYCPEKRVAFTGDTLFSMDIGRTDLPGGCEEQMGESLQLLVSHFPDDMALYPGHGRKTTMGHEKACNPFL